MKTRLAIFLSSAAFALGIAAQNPYLPLWEHVPDGEPRVFEDPDRPGRYRAYIIGSHDVTYSAYCGPDIRMWSAPVEDLSQWRDEGPVFTYYVDGQWDTMYAPDLVEVKDKQTGRKVYYLYPHSRGWMRVPMVCKGDRPDGPFTPINLDEDGRRCLPGSQIDFDPSVFIEDIRDRRDPDFSRGFRAYVFYGFQHSTAMELDQENMFAKRPGTELIDNFLPASTSYGKLRDPEGTNYPALMAGQDPGEFNFFEASSIRQIGNKYVMVFSGHSGPDYGLWSTNSALRYAYGDSPLGPWRSGGVLVDSRGVEVSEDGSHLITTNAGHNTHGSLQEINGQWYVFYHRPPRGFGFARQAMVAPVKIEWDKKKVADGGQVRIRAYNPFAPREEWTARASDGTEYTGAEVTSEGFQIYGLPPYRYLSAGYACYMSDQGWLQDTFDCWDNNMDLAGIRSGAVIGFKYFGFGGLAKDSKGVRAFPGAEKGNATKLHLWLTPTAGLPFRIHVMLDGPYANEVWKGKEIGTVEVPGEAPHRRQSLTLDVAQWVEGLSGKHAIYLVAEGPDVPPVQRQPWERKSDRPHGLFDLHGLGFSGKGHDCQPPMVPRVTVCVDGQPLVMPDTPLRSSNLNGYTENNRYQLYARLTESSIITATATSPDVKVEVGRIADGRATVVCSYQGKKKVYLIN